MSPSELLELLSKHEGLKLDFKREYKLYDTPPSTTDKIAWAEFVKGQWDEFIRDIIALANGNVGTAGQKGFLIIGADDELPKSGVRQVYDTTVLTITDHQVLSKINAACDPPIPQITCERIQIEGKQVLVVVIDPSPYFHETTRQLQTTKGAFDTTGALRHFEIDKTYSPRTAFVRRGEGVYPATDDERRIISIEKIASLQKRVDHIELDRKLFLEIRAILKDAIWYVRETDFRGLFEPRYLARLYGFEQFCKQPECEFIDEDIEKLRLQLLNTIQSFLRAIGEHTFPEKRDPKWSRIPRDPMQESGIIVWFHQKATSEAEFQKLVEEQRAHVHRIGVELNENADQVRDAYDEFVKFGRRKLAV